MNRRLLSRVLASVFLAVAVSVPLAAADRVALVIGNGDYENVAKLENPGNDASAFASVLRAGGYEVIEVIDGGVGDMALALKRFARLGESAEKAVFYYAGHGFEVEGKNYLAPVDAALEIDADLSGEDADLALEFALERESVPLDLVLRELRHSVGGLKLIVLDCCRDNPFAKSRGWARSRSGVSGGLARVAESELPEGTMLVFSGAPGQPVPDGSGRHSPFTGALLEQMEAKKGEGMMFVFTGVAESKLALQKPWVKFDGSGESLSAFTVEPLLPRDADVSGALASGGADGSIESPNGSGSEAERLRRELEAMRARVTQAEENARLAAELAKKQQRLEQIRGEAEERSRLDSSPNRSGGLGGARWVIACEAESTEAAAQRAAARWSARGLEAGVLWIPDYSSLSGAKLWLTYVGPFDYADREAVRSALRDRVLPYYGEAYGIKVDQSGRRETLR